MDKDETEKELFSTRDLYLASTLVTMGFFMLNVDFQIEGEKRLPVGYFSFEETQELKELVQKYWQGHIQVEPRSYITNLRGLKAQVSNVYNNPKMDLSKFEKKS